LDYPYFGETMTYFLYSFLFPLLLFFLIFLFFSFFPATVLIMVNYYQ